MFTISYFIRKYKSKCRLTALDAADGNPDIMPGSNLLCDRKAEPRSVFILLRPRLIKAFENQRQILLFDTGAGIRYGNRIANGKFTLDGVEYQLPQNNNGHCLHGGPEGYHTVVWDAKQVNDQSVELTYLSKDGEAGFPGNLNLKVTYTLTNDNAVDIKYEATTDKPTVVNLTNHSYFNLSGVPGSQILDHSIMIAADTYVPVDETLIPTGTLDPVEGTPMDLRTAVAVGAHIDDPFDQLVRGKGYDHNWVLNNNCDINVLAAKAVSAKSGIGLEVYTNEPGIQFYAGNAMTKDGDKGKLGVIYPHRGALCLETQHYPDSPNQPSFPSVVLRPGEKYFSECIYKFTVEK